MLVIHRQAVYRFELVVVIRTRINCKMRKHDSVLSVTLADFLSYSCFRITLNANLESDSYVYFNAQGCQDSS